MKKITELPPFLHGVLMMAVGSILLLYTLGILEKGLGIIIILGSLYLIFQGMVASGVYETIQKLIKHR